MSAPQGLRWKAGSVRRPDDIAWAGDRWLEALLGARLRFHAGGMVDDGRGPETVRMYRRWQRLYHAGNAGLIAGYEEVEA